MASHQKPSVLILGMSVNGLSVARSLGRKGIPVIALERGKPLPTVHSHYVKAWVSTRKEAGDSELLEGLVAIRKRYTGPMLLFPTNDFFVLFVSRNRDALKPHFHFMIASPDMIESFIDKSRVYPLTESYGFSIPKTLHSPRLEGVENVEKVTGFPCFIKPVYSHIWREEFRDEKVILIENKHQLVSWLQKVERAGQDVIVQEMISGPDNEHVAIIALMDERSRPLGVASKRKLRQFPVGAGEGSFQVTIKLPELETKVVEFLQEIGYAGIAEFEFKRDGRDGLYKLIEINPRTVTWQELVTQAGVDMPFMIYQSTMGQGIAPTNGYKIGMRWLCFEWDLEAFLQARRMKLITTSEWLRSLLEIQVFGYFSWDDPIPFLIQTSRFLKRSVSYVFPGRLGHGWLHQGLHWMRGRP